MDDPSSTESAPLKVLYEDNHLLAIFKPHRLSMQSYGKGSRTVFLTACQYLKEKYQKTGNVYLGMIHRLDRAVSGVVLFGKTSKAASRLSEQIRERQMRKSYEALVEGEMSGEGLLEDYLVYPEDEPTRVVSADTPGAKIARLRYRHLGSKAGCSRLCIELETGRRHQIRVQLSSRGFPILGDGKYGGKVEFLPGSIALTAVSLGFKHPVKDEEMEIRLPSELSSVELGWRGLHGN